MCTISGIGASVNIAIVMVAEHIAPMAASAGPASPTIGHEGIANVTINPDSVNQLMDGAQAIEAASSGVNEGTGIEAIKLILRTMALVIRALVRLLC